MFRIRCGQDRHSPGKGTKFQTDLGGMSRPEAKQTCPYRGELRVGKQHSDYALDSRRTSRLRHEFFQAAEKHVQDLDLVIFARTVVPNMRIVGYDRRLLAVEIECLDNRVT